MIAAAITGPTDPGTLVPGLTSIQDVLVLHPDGNEMHRLARYLAGICRPLQVGTERQLLTALDDTSIQLAIIDATSGFLRDGFHICSRLRSMPGLAHIAVILLIPADDMDARLACLRSGADAWIERPLSRDYLRAQVGALLANRRRLKSYFTQSPALKPHPMAAAGSNPSFSNRLQGTILHHLADSGLNVDVLAREMNVSRPTLYRKLRAISDRTPNEWVNLIRLDKAAELLSLTDHKILEVAKMVGFRSRSNFGKAFVKHFGATPAEYRNRSHRQTVHN